MSGKTASTISQLEKMIMEYANSVLKEEMTEMVKEKESIHVKTDVYDVYPDPVIYQRRNFHNGSLGDEEQIDAYLISDGILEVINNNDFNHAFARRFWGYGSVDLDKSLAENIEKGYGSMAEPWNEPRPFIENTREEIKSQNLHVEIMKKGLRAKGLTVI